MSKVTQFYTHKKIIVQLYIIQVYNTASTLIRKCITSHALKMDNNTKYGILSQEFDIIFNL